MPYVGLSTLYIQFFNRPFQEVIDTLKVQRDQELEPEVWEMVDQGEHELQKERVRMLQEFAQQGYRFTVHGPYDEAMNISDREPVRRRYSRARLRKSVDAAADLEAQVWVLHPGSVDQKSRSYVQLNDEAILELLDYGHGRGVKAAVENMTLGSSYHLATPSDFQGFQERTGVRPYVVFDAGHAERGYLIDAFIRNWADRFTTVHVHDNHGASDEHLNVGEGSIDWLHITRELSKRDFRGFYVVEAIREPFRSISALRGMLKQTPEGTEPPKTSSPSQPPH